MHQVTRILSGTYSLPWINTLLLHLFAKYLPKSSNDCLKLSNSQIPTFSLYKTSCFFATSRLGRFFLIENWWCFTYLYVNFYENQEKISVVSKNFVLVAVESRFVTMLHKFTSSEYYELRSFWSFLNVASWIVVECWKPHVF